MGVKWRYWICKNIHITELEIVISTTSSTSIFAQSKDKPTNLSSSLCAALVVGLPTAVQAQRLVPGQKGLEVSASMPIVKGKSLFKQDDLGLTLSLSHYLKRGKYTFVSAGYEQQALSYRSYQVPLRDYLVQMGYAYPLLSDKGKNVFFYLGASALVGYEQLNRDKMILPDGATLLYL